MKVINRIKAGKASEKKEKEKVCPFCNQTIRLIPQGLGAAPKEKCGCFKGLSGSVGFGFM